MERFSPRVLVVDDDAAIREVYKEWLRSAGFRVLIARGGREALLRAEETPPDAVILDLSMPSIDGLEVARRLRCSAATSRVPIIAVTGYPLREIAMRAHEAGCTSLLAKPIDASELLVILGRLLDGNVAAATR